MSQATTPKPAPMTERSLTAPANLFTSVNTFNASFMQTPQTQTMLEMDNIGSWMSAMTSFGNSMHTTGGNSSSLATARKLSLNDLCKASASMSTELAELVQEIAPGAEGNPLRWCNHLYAGKCPYNVTKEGVAIDECKFLHIDAFVQQPLCEREGAMVPNLMEKNMKGLMKEMNKLVNARAQKRLEAYSIITAWCGGSNQQPQQDISPYSDTVHELRKLGWVIPHQDPLHHPVAKLEEAPYAKVVNSILMLIAHSLHFDLQGSPEVMFQTVRLAFNMKALPVQEEECLKDVGMSAKDQVLDVLVEEGEDIPPLLQSLSLFEHEGSSLDMPPSPTMTPTYHMPHNSPMNKTKKSRRSKRKKPAKSMAGQELESMIPTLDEQSMGSPRAYTAPDELLLAALAQLSCN